MSISPTSPAALEKKLMTAGSFPVTSGLLVDSR
jgi:hypothetical protein